MLQGLLLVFEPLEAKPELGFASKASLEGLEVGMVKGIPFWMAWSQCGKSYLTDRNVRG